MNDSKCASGLDLLHGASNAIGFNAMDKPMIPAWRDPNDYNDKDDDSIRAREDDSIACSNEDFDLHIGDVDDSIEKVFDEDNITKDANGNGCDLTVKEIVSRLLKLPFHKMKSRSNNQSLTKDESEMIEEDSTGDSHYSQSARNAAKIFFNVFFLTVAFFVSELCFFVHCDF